MLRRADRTRPEFRCGICGVNLGRSPWLGLPDDPHTACGCFESRKKSKMIIKPTKSEKIKAITDTVKPVANYLVEIGKIDAFKDFTKDEICGLIRVAQEGVQSSLKAQCNFDPEYGDEIPF